MSQALISVALSVYNGARYLPEQLDSVLAQRNVALEVIAVDDGSTDGSLEVLHEYARRDARVRVHRNPSNLGPTRSFERAMALGSGELIAPCDQDDRWHPDKLATLQEALGTADLAYCDSRYIDAAGTPIGRRVSDDKRMMSGQRPLSFVLANSVSGHAALLRRSLFEAVRPLPPELYYDWALAMFAAARHGIVYVDQALVDFRRHAQAHSSLGKRGGTRGPCRQRRWFGERLGLARALADSGFDTSGSAARLAEAFAQALPAVCGGPLLRSVWRERRALTPDGRHPGWRAVRLQAELLRKLHRAQHEPTLNPDRGPVELPPASP